jgi:transposase
VEANYHKKMKASKADLEKALTGRVSEHHRFMLRQIYAHMAYLEGQIALIDAQIKETLSADEEVITLLTDIPGVGLKSAIQIVSEVGTDLSKFPTEKHFAKWAGMAPGNNESAGKKKVVALRMVTNI